MKKSPKIDKSSFIKESKQFFFENKGKVFCFVSALALITTLYCNIVSCRSNTDKKQTSKSKAISTSVVEDEVTPGIEPEPTSSVEPQETPSIEPEPTSSVEPQETPNTDNESDNSNAFALNDLTYDYSAGASNYVVCDGKIYYSPQSCFMYNDSLLVLELFEIKNELSTAISIHNINFIVDSYQDKDASEAIEYTITYNAAGDLYNQIFHGEINPIEGNNTLQYCGEDDAYYDSDSENFIANFEPSGGHVSIDSGEFEYFAMALEFKKSGLYKFRYSIEYAADNTTSTYTITSPEIERFVSESFAASNEDTPRFFISGMGYDTEAVLYLDEHSPLIAKGEEEYNADFEEKLMTALNEYKEKLDAIQE